MKEEEEEEVVWLTCRPLLSFFSFCYTSGMLYPLMNSAPDSLSQPLSTISSIQSSKHLRKKPLSRESIVAVSPETCASRVEL